MALGVNQSVLLTLCAAIMVAMKVVDAVYIEDTDRFPGWKGELPQAVGEKGANTIGYGEGGVVRSPFLLQHMLSSAYVVLYLLYKMWQYVLNIIVPNSCNTNI